MAAPRPRLSQSPLSLSCSSLSTSLALSARGPSGLLQHSSLFRQRELKPVLRNSVSHSSVSSPRTSGPTGGGPCDGCSSPSGRGRPTPNSTGKCRRQGPPVPRDGAAPRRMSPCPSTSPPRNRARVPGWSNRSSAAAPRKHTDGEPRVKGAQQNRSRVTTEAAPGTSRRASVSSSAHSAIPPLPSSTIPRRADAGEKSAAQRQQQDNVQEGLSQSGHNQHHDVEVWKQHEENLQKDLVARRLKRELSFEAIALFLKDNGFTAVADQMRASVREASSRVGYAGIVGDDAFGRAVQQLGITLSQVVDRQWDAEAAAAAHIPVADGVQTNRVEANCGNETWASDVIQKITVSPEIPESVPPPPWKKRFDAELEEHFNVQAALQETAISIEGNSELYAAGVLTSNVPLEGVSVAEATPVLECGPAAGVVSTGDMGNRPIEAIEGAEVPEEERPMPQKPPRSMSSMHYLPMKMGTPEGFIDYLPDEYRDDNDPGYRIREISEAEFIAELHQYVAAASLQAENPLGTSSVTSYHEEDSTLVDGNGVAADDDELQEATARTTPSEATSECNTLFKGATNGPVGLNSGRGSGPSLEVDPRHVLCDGATSEDILCASDACIGLVNDDNSLEQTADVASSAACDSALVYAPCDPCVTGGNKVSVDDVAADGGESQDTSAIGHRVEGAASGAPELTGREPLPHFGGVHPNASGRVEVKSSGLSLAAQAYAAVGADAGGGGGFSAVSQSHLPEGVGDIPVGASDSTTQLSQKCSVSYPVELQGVHDASDGQHQQVCQIGEAAAAAVAAAAAAVAAATTGWSGTNAESYASAYSQSMHASFPHALPAKRKDKSRGQRPPCRHAPSGDPFYPVQLDGIVYDSFPLRIIYERDCTGFEESKEFPIQMNSIIAARYQVLAYLGSAAFSRAVQCLDLETNTMVCMKIIKNDKDFLDQSLDEIKLLKIIASNTPNVDDKHCLQLVDCFYHKEHLIIVTELLRDNLYEFSKFNRECGAEPYFTLGRLQRITKQVLVALEYIHSLWLIHADLKPENILVKSYSRCEVKVIDFGSSCFMNDHLSSYVQSRSYRAPEVMLGLPYDQKVDIWSLGCIVAELWAGFVLFQNDCVQTLLARICGIVGAFPQHMLATGKLAAKYFAQDGRLFRELETSTSPGGSPHIGHGGRRFHVYLPKKSSIRQRMRCTDDLFVDFLETLLTLDPAKRPGSAEALRHPWLTPGMYPDGL